MAYLLTYPMVQSPSWEANWSADSQETPRISRNPKVHYRTHKRPPPVSILSQPNPVHIQTSHFLEIHPNIIRPSTPRSPQWSPSLRFPHQDHNGLYFLNVASYNACISISRFKAAIWEGKSSASPYINILLHLSYKPRPILNLTFHVTTWAA